MDKHQIINVLITFYLKQKYIDQIKAIDHRINILYEPELYGKPRYENDQHGGPINRTPKQEARWLELLSDAEILFGYLSRPYLSNLEKYAPNLIWNQVPSAGIGQMISRNNLFDSKVLFTTASGVHSTPLGEFCLMSMLMFVKGYFHMAEEKKKKHWQRTCTTELHGKTLAIIGLGSVGKEVARLSKSLGMNVIGTKRTIDGVDPSTVYVEKLYPYNDIRPMLSQADFIVIICPLTSETEGLVGEKEFASMKKGAVLINISRGRVVDEPSLIKALQSGHLAGLASDVFWDEPLPPDSPFWEMPNVIISPHSASTADTENGKHTEIFTKNIRHYLDDQPLLNLLNKQLLY
jgi:glyoxylate/hydroxypyruvate reductase A